ncbi:dTDP-4-dehydrorhamnose reductase [candidate division KSB1 bacterium]|nr:SDR family oxidoreductase [bacterium]OQX58384.1 MAG: hypothetical protein B5M50_04445 [candidate division KSB1 bacterium 4484_219]RKY85987.1 MAG: dTDP-4-dehydrorhamnose reductase [candidate division KSB1 bacterium]HDI51539.1 SDR family oxidoreductase [Bacteroidota bacterium]
MESILITGGSGFLGGALIVRAISKHWKVFATYHKHPPQFDDVNWLPLDLSDFSSIQQIFQYSNPDVVIHTAALTHVDWCEAHQCETKLVNVLGTEILAKLCQEHNTRLIYVSTDLVFDGEKGNYSEEDKTNPVSYYGWSKLEGEKLVQINCENHVIARSALMYGRPALRGTSFSEWLRTTWAMGKITPLFYDQYRTPIEVNNLADALLELASNSFVGTIHLGGSQKIDRVTFGNILARILGVSADLICKVSMKEATNVALRPQDVSLNISKAQTLLRTQFLNCEEGLQKAYET